VHGYPERVTVQPEPASKTARAGHSSLEPARQEPAAPEPARQEPARQEPAAPEPARLEPARPEPARPEPAQPEPDAKDWTWTLTRVCPECRFDAAGIEHVAIPTLIRDAVSHFPEVLARSEVVKVCETSGG